MNKLSPFFNYELLLRKIRTLDVGDTVYENGGKGHQMWLVLYGKLELKFEARAKNTSHIVLPDIRREPQRLSTMEARPALTLDWNHFVGEEAVLDRHYGQRFETCTVLQRAGLLEIPKSWMKELERIIVEDKMSQSNIAGDRPPVEVRKDYQTFVNTVRRGHLTKKSIRNKVV